jgi:hypothetical protein
LLDEIRDEHEKASHKNMASLVLEKAMVMEEYMMTRHESFITSYKLVMGQGKFLPAGFV